MQSTKMLIGGVVLTSFGAIGLLAGSSMFSASSRESFERTTCVPESFCPPPEDHAGLRAAGMITLIASGVAIAGGIPLIIIGLKRVPVKPEAKSAHLRLEVRVGSPGGVLRLQF
jgi:hypothetical protein